MRLGMVSEVVEVGVSGSGSSESVSAWKAGFIKKNVLPNGPLAVQKSKHLVETVFTKMNNLDYLFEFTVKELEAIRQSEEVAQGAGAMLMKQKPPWAVESKL